MHRARAAVWCLGAVALGWACDACLLTTPLAGFAGAADVDSGGPAADAAADARAAVDRDAATPDADAAVAVTSCDALKRATPTTQDGFQTIDPDGAAGPIAPFVAWCDMTSDGGGWMLVSPVLVGDETSDQATVTRGTDDHGGLFLRVYANSPGCSASVTPTRHRFIIRDWPPWSRVRLKQIFAGHASCWHIWGGLEGKNPMPSNLAPFDPALDVIRDAVKMGGSIGDAFDGKPSRCDTTPTNFWDYAQPLPRSARVIVRRSDPVVPAGLSTGADCGDVAAGTTSPLYWEYREIYVK